MKKLKILMLHNKYVLLGGEDISTATEASLLRLRGHHVDLIEVSNSDLSDSNPFEVALHSILGGKGYELTKRALLERRYDIVHVQNYFPQFSPNVHRLAKSFGVPTVQHLRNFRYTCANSFLYRNNNICTECLGKKVGVKGFLHKCYRNSYPASAVAISTIAIHKALGTWHNAVGGYIATSDFVRDVHVASGLPAERIWTRPNVIVHNRTFEKARTSDVVFAGRLSAEKGVDDLIQAWQSGDKTGRLLIVGEGPEEDRLKALANADPKILFLKSCSHDKVLELFAESSLVVVPSRWPEAFGRVALEAMSVGTPVVAYRSGGLVDVLGADSDLLCNVGDLRALSQLITNCTYGSEFWSEASLKAVERYNNRFSARATISRTEAIYESVIRAYVA